MTMNTSILATTIDAIRLTCKDCGVALIMPIDSTKEVPHKCFNCYMEFPYQSLQEFIRDFRHMRGQLCKAGMAFMVHMDHDGKER